MENIYKDPTTKSGVSQIVRKRKGFSLIELSIVLVIISLLIAGASGGSRLLQASKLNGLTKDILHIKMMFSTFSQQYKALPGDYNDAAFLWGCSSCDGDRDGIINSTQEKLQSWKHLEHADILNQQVTGTLPGTSPFFGTENAYNIKYSSTAVAVIQEADLLPSATYTYDATNFVYYVIVDSNYIDTTHPLLTPEEAYKIDIKIDNGLPKSGKIFGALAACYSGDDYDATTKTLVCNIASTVEY